MALEDVVKYALVDDAGFRGIERDICDRKRKAVKRSGGDGGIPLVSCRAHV